MPGEGGSPGLSWLKEPEQLSESYFLWGRQPQLLRPARPPCQDFRGKALLLSLKRGASNSQSPFKPQLSSHFTWGIVFEGSLLSLLGWVYYQRALIARPAHVSLCLPHCPILPDSYRLGAPLEGDCGVYPFIPRPGIGLGVQWALREGLLRDRADKYLKYVQSNALHVFGLLFLYGWSSPFLS